MPDLGRMPSVMLASPDGDLAADLRSRLLSFEFSDHDNKADQFRLGLDNSDLGMFEIPQLQSGALVVVSWGYPRYYSAPRRFILGPSSGRGKKATTAKGFDQISMEGRSHSIQLDRDSKTRKWEGVKRSDVASEIAAEYGFSGGSIFVEDSEIVLGAIVQTGQTDKRFLRRLAKIEGYRFKIDERGFHFHSRKFDTDPTRTYSYRGSGVLDVNWDQNLWAQPVKVKTKSQDPEAGKEVEQVGQGGDDTNLAQWEITDFSEEGDPVWVFRKNDGQSADVDDWISTVGDTAKILSGWPAVKSAAGVLKDAFGGSLGMIDVQNLVGKDAQRRARAKFRNLKRKRIELSLRVVGDPTLVSGEIVTLEGFGPILSGKYYTRSVTHRIEGGYSCELDLIRGGAKKPRGKIAQKSDGPINDRNDPASYEALKNVALSGISDGFAAAYQGMQAPTPTIKFDDDGNEVIEYN